MGKTTNILDLNNRLTKVEKGNVAQNSYTSLKNKPKINNVTLTGNKTLADIGAAAAADLINPVGGAVVVTLSSNTAYGFYYFLFPSTAFARGKTVTITGANFIGDTTELKTYILPEAYNPTEIGQIYKISDENTTGLSAATYGNPLLISFTVS